ncbi:MAG: hypothetical protein ACI8W8_002229 [Rhodothermales bacterium]|jgi:hypothetical protein
MSKEAIAKWRDERGFTRSANLQVPPRARTDTYYFLFYVDHVEVSLDFDMKEKRSLPE